jgi:hypothetical protein
VIDPPSDGPEWIQRTCRVCQDLRSSGSSIVQSFRDAGPDLTDRGRFVSLVTDYLRSHTYLIGSWQQHSWDKRVSSGPYLEGNEVGYYTHGKQEVVIHDDPSAACADFLYREATGVLSDRH